MPGGRASCRSFHRKGRYTWSIPIQRFPIFLSKFVGKRRLPMGVHRQEIRKDAQCAQDHKERKADDDYDGKYTQDGLRDFHHFAAACFLTHATCSFIHDCSKVLLKDWIIVRVLLQGLFPVAARRQMDLREYHRESLSVGANLVVDKRDEYARRRLIVDRIWDGVACHCVSPMVR